MGLSARHGGMCRQALAAFVRMGIVAAQLDAAPDFGAAARWLAPLAWLAAAALALFVWRAAGSNAAIDRAIHFHEPLRQFLRQGVNEGFPARQSWEVLARTMATAPAAKPAPPPSPKRV